MEPRDIQKLEELCVQDEAPWCQASCPLHVDARGMLNAVARGDFHAAASIYGKKVPFPGILSRVCDQPCRTVCKRREVDDAINIRLVERSCADYAGFTSALTKNGPPKLGPGRVAVVGGGLSGLTTAVELVRKQYQVSLFEESSRLGGRLLLLPNDVLPLEIMHEEIGRLTQGCIDIYHGIHLGLDIGLADLLELYDAVYLGVGEINAKSNNLDPATYQAITGGIDSLTLATSQPTVFAGGTLRRTMGNNRQGVNNTGWGDYSPVASMSDGRRAATSIDRCLKGESLTSQRQNEGPYETRLYTNVAGIKPTRIVSPGGPGSTYTRNEAIAEAGRCLQCRCLECVKACAYLDHFKEYPGTCIRKVTKNITSLPGKSYRTHTPFINACSLCGLCGTVCPSALNMAVVNSEARRNMWNKGFMPPAIHEFAVQDMESSNTGPEAMARNQPGHNSSSHLFFPGCQLTASAPHHVERTYLYLMNKLSGGVGLMLACCGAPAAWAGRRELFDRTLGTFTHRWNEMGQPRVILACPTCSLMFRENLPSIPAVSLWEVLDSEGLPEDGPRGQGMTLALHDSCTARSAPDIQDSVRNITRKLGYQIEELPYNREMTKCCGYGGLLYQVNRAVTDKIIESRIRESPSDYLTYCTNCRDFFAGKAKTSYHVLDLVFDGISAGDTARPGPALSNRRRNRRELAQRMLTTLWRETMPEPQEHTKLKLRFLPDVIAKMDQDFILVEDVQHVIHQAEMTGNKCEVPATGRFIAHYRPSLVTYWVEYAVNGDEYEVFNVYSHRMQLVKDVMQ